MSPLTAVPVVASLYSAALAVAHWTGVFSTTAVAITYAFISLAVITGAALAIPRSKELKEITGKQFTVFVWTVVGVLVYVAWMVVALIRDEWFYLLMSLAGLCPVVILAGMAVLGYVARPVTGALIRSALPSTLAQKVTETIHRAGYPQLRVMDVELIDENRGYQALLQEMSPHMMSMLGITQGQVFSEKAATRIGIAHRELTGAPVQNGWVTVREANTVGEWYLTIHSRSVLADIRPYIDDPTEISIRDAFPVGCYDNGDIQYHSLAHHGQLIGKSGAGKSAFAQLAIANATRMRDAVQWIGGLEKLYDLVAPWIGPYEGTSHRLPLDWIATGQRDTKEMLRAALSIARGRQDTPYAQRIDWPWIIIWIDEAWQVLQDMETSSLLAELRRLGLSAHIVVQLMSQRGVNTDFGVAGGDIKTNAGWAAVFATRDGQEIGRTLGDWAVQPDLAPGQCILKSPETSPDTATGLRPIRVYYIQDPDPAKKRLHDGIRIDEVSWSRRDRTAQLDERSAQWAGGVYGSRHTHWSPALEEYLTSRATSTLALEPAESSVDAIVEAAIAKVIAEETATDPDPEPVSSRVAIATGTGMTGLVRRERVLKILGDHGPLSPRDIAHYLREMGDEAPSMQSLGNLLSKLVADGVVIRAGRGVYELAG